MSYIYEVFLKRECVGKVEWNEFFLQVADYLDNIAHWQMYLVAQHNVIHYYLVSEQPLPASLNLVDFLLKPQSKLDLNFPSTKSRGFWFNQPDTNFLTVLQDLYRHQYHLSSAKISFVSYKSILTGTIKIYYTRGDKTYTKQLILFAPSNFASLDFSKNKNFLFKKFPKYLKLEKVTKLLSTNSDSALFEIDPFPYFDQSEYLCHQDYDFAKHSLIVGASGSGKSRFLASLIYQISQTNRQDYKVVVIDPHDALYQDCAGIASQSVINFQTLENSINLFYADSHNINASVELLLSLFQSLINDSYNGRLERVLRYATYLLLTAQEFSFLTLRKLLLDLEYRNQLVTRFQRQLPASVAHFFLTDFNELKTQNYNEAIAPIVAFIDEMQMVPVFNSEESFENLTHIVQNNFLSIFSLNRLKLGDKVSRTIAGLLMQQLFLLAQEKLPQHLIIIIDEVAVVENPIIARFLSELRKYNASVILAGQYFDQISPTLQSAIFANTSNYYLFRTSESDAKLLTQNLKIQVEGSDNPDDAKKLLTGLKLRECLVQISAEDELLPIFKARTTDYLPPKQYDFDPLLDQEFTFSVASEPIPKTPEHEILDQEFSLPIAVESEDFDIGDVDVNKFTENYSTNRKVKGV